MKKIRKQVNGKLNNIRSADENKEEMSLQSLYLKTIRNKKLKCSLLHPAQANLGYFLRGFSLSSCPQHSLKVLLL
jgi:hypothetical protein